MYLPELRKALAGEYLDKATFDAAMLSLAKAGLVPWQSHSLPSALSPAEREAMIPNPWGSYDMAVGTRMA